MSDGVMVAVATDDGACADEATDGVADEGVLVFNGSVLSPVCKNDTHTHTHTHTEKDRVCPLRLPSK